MNTTTLGTRALNRALVFDPLSPGEADAVIAEGQRLLEFAASDAEGQDIRVRHIR